MSEPTNSDRADFAQAALGTFMKATGSESDTAIRDLLADIQHLADREGIDFDTESRLAATHYREEVANESDTTTVQAYINRLSDANCRDLAERVWVELYVSWDGGAQGWRVDRDKEWEIESLEEAAIFFQGHCLVPERGSADVPFEQLPLIKDLYP